jgi:predicted DNA-binding transcriptional regulator AlpA
MKSTEPRFFTCDELADRWSKPKKWIYSNWRSRAIPVCHLGQQLRFPVEEIERWEQSNMNHQKR